MSDKVTLKHLYEAAKDESRLEHLIALIKQYAYAFDLEYSDDLSIVRELVGHDAIVGAFDRSLRFAMPMIYLNDRDGKLTLMGMTPYGVRAVTEREVRSAIDSGRGL